MVDKVQKLIAATFDTPSSAPYGDSSQEVGHYCKHHSLFVLVDGDA
jgi:hypothetical protein